MTRLTLLLVVMMVSPLAARDADPTGGARAAVARALPLLQRSAATFVAERACVSCHHNALALLALREAQRQGLAIDGAVLAAVESKTFRELRADHALDDAVQGTAVADPTPNDSYLLMAAHASGVPRGLVTAVLAYRMARWQRPDGHFITSDFRPPHSSSLFTTTATAIRALAAYMPDELAAERDRVVERAASWLAATPPHSTEDAAFRLMGLVWAGAPAAARAAARQELLSRQHAGGGWAQLPSYDADAYSTGEALYALHEDGMAPVHPVWRRGQGFLVRTQARDGSWRVRTRMISPATVSPPYFFTGFPYGKDEFLSFAGSCWAVLALSSSLSAPAATAPQPLAEPAAPAWLRTALFGTGASLTAALDAGLDPNSATPGGTTLLMAAASDAAKTRLLLARGARPDARSATGADALVTAAGYFGNGTSVQALLDAGAEAQPPAGVRVRRTPLVLASMSGDLDVVRRLLAGGAKASAEAAAEAVTFGHAEVLRALVAAGASVSGVESSGITLLHWAAITNRATVIPVLVQAGVPLDEVDEAGYTPLMYAATIDQGDTATLDALLTAGANRTIRNAEGRTPLQQARRLKHAALAQRLR